MAIQVGVTFILLVLGSCWGLQNNDVDEEPRLVFQPSKYGSLWPLPQKVQISEVSFKLSSSSFRIIDAKESRAGASCSLLQLAYRRSEGMGLLFLSVSSVSVVMHSRTCLLLSAVSLQVL
ncbi:hypothetical protein ILYODFUR_038968 [Ilyodon furcidens]|uniref:Uncharacterized protein n=1 Tax=Ilyodon furcidens TaxID=33524 RepID=A0ABV0U551_9TELE